MNKGIQVFILLAIGCNAAYSQRSDTFCWTGSYWGGQTCLPCLNRFCTCSSLYGCDKVLCGFGLIQPQSTQSCVKCPKGCLSCTVAGNGGFKCQTCAIGYSQIQNICIIDNNLASRGDINGGGRWELQIQSQSRISPTTLPCLDLDTSTSLCQLCPKNSFTNEFGQCEKCVTGCDQCTSRGTCGTCQIGTFWMANANTAVSTNGWGAGLCAGCTGFGVQTCNSTGFALTCTQGFYFQTGRSAATTCAPCSSNCAVCSSQTSCSQCQVGSYLKSGACYQCFGNSASSYPCMTCDSGQSTSCDTCSNGFQMVGNGCQMCIVQIPGCASCSVVGTQLSCDTCYMGFYRLMGSNNQASCVPCTSSQPSYLYCSKDDNGNNANVTVTQCQQSQSGMIGANAFFLTATAANPTVKSCTKNKNQCLTMQSDNGLCNTCDSAYVNVNGICQLGIRFCLSTTVQGSKVSCGTCVNGYTPNSDFSQCSPCSQGCATCNGQGCTACAIGLTLNGTTCKSCQIDYCQNCDGNVKTCSTCRPQFFLYQASNNVQQCLLCPPGCQNCQASNGQKCQTCLPGYYIWNDGCYQGAYKCAVYNKDGTCDTCQYGMRQSKGNCYPCVSFNGAYVCGKNAGSTACSTSYLTQTVTFILILMLIQQ